VRRDRLVGDRHAEGALGALALGDRRLARQSGADAVGHVVVAGLDREQLPLERLRLAGEHRPAGPRVRVRRLAVLRLAVEDPQLADNAGGWRVEVSGGRARVARAAAGSARVDIATLGAIWSGMLAPVDARRLGRLVADDETVQALGEMFAGPIPWINDWF